MKRITKMFTFLLMPLVLSNVSCNKDTKPYKVETTIKSVTNVEFGNVNFETTQTEIEEAGIEYGDTVNLTMYDVKEENNDFKIREGGFYKFENLPFVTNYNEVGYYAPCLCNYQKASANFDISFGINKLKNHAKDLIPNESGNKIKVTIELNTKGGYKNTLDLVSCPTKLSYEKVDRNNLVYANFRDVTSIGDISKKMKSDRYYRGSSPFNARGNNGKSDPRYLYADELMGRYGITHEISLSVNNNNKDAEVKDVDGKKYKGYPISSYMYINQTITEKDTINSRKLYNGEDAIRQDARGSKEFINDSDEVNQKTFLTVGLGPDYFSDTEGVQEGKTMTKRVFKYIADVAKTDSNKIYLHCDEGKDRTGFFSMVVEALCGVSYRDIVADFMCTFKNYFEFSRKDDASKLKYDTMKRQTVCRHVYSICVEDPSIVNWSAINAEDELRNIGITENDENNVSNETITLQEHATNYMKRLFGKTEGNTIADNIKKYLGK